MSLVTPVFNDRYEIQQRLVRAAWLMSTWLDRLLERRVAVKVLFPEFATDPSPWPDSAVRRRREPHAPQHRGRLRLGPQAATTSSSWST
jgi:hypothetical protein